MQSLYSPPFEVLVRPSKFSHRTPVKLKKEGYIIGLRRFPRRPLDGLAGLWPRRGGFPHNTHNTEVTSLVSCVCAPSRKKSSAATDIVSGGSTGIR